MSKRISVVLVVLILVICAGMVTAWIGQVREAAARTGCINELKQIGLGLDAWNDSLRHYPSGTLPNKTLPPEKRLGWPVQVVSMLGIDARFDRDLSWDAEKNLKPYGFDMNGKRYAQEVQGVFLCPANTHFLGPHGLGLTHYVGIAGVGEDAAAQPQIDRKSGLFGYDRCTKREDIKDGLSTTLAVVETATNNGPWTAGGPATVRGLLPSASPYLGEAGQFSSKHRSPILTQAVFLDGSVRRLDAHVSPQVFEALATIAGGEEIESLWP